MGLPPTLNATLQSPQPSKWRRFVLWLVFVFLIALFSTLATCGIQFLSGHSSTLSTLLAEGDGFLFTIAITADAIGRGIDRTSLPRLRILACFIVLAGAAMAFTIVKADLLNHRGDVEKALKCLDVIQSTDQAEAAYCAKAGNAHNAQTQDLQNAYLQNLVEVLRETPKYPEGKVFEASLVLVALGLFTSLLIVVID